MQLLNQSNNLILIEKYVHYFKTILKKEPMVFDSATNRFNEAVQCLKNMHLSVLFNH